MNINTNTLLNTLLTKVDSTLKAKIEKHSVDGKVDISALGKEKGIGTLLNQLFKDISSGTKNKTEVNSLLENSKQSLKFKNISSELKQIINLLTKELKNTPELTKLTTLVKETLIDMKNIDEKIIKSTFQNSGVFLESKLSKSNDTVSTNLKNLLNQFNDKVKILNSMEKTVLNNNMTEQKIPKIANNIGEPKPESSPVKSLNILKDIIPSKMTNIFNEATSENKKTSQNEMGIEKISSKISKFFSELKGDVSFPKSLNISSEVKSDVKVEIQNILKKVESTQQLPQLEKQLSSLKSVVTDIKNLEQKLVSLNIKNDIPLNLKELVQQVKNNLLNNSAQVIDKTIFTIKDQLENIKSIDLTEIKKDVKNIDVKIEKLQSEKNIESKIVIIKDLIQNTTSLVDKINNGNIKELLKNNISELKNISGDLKTIMSKVKELVEQPNTTDTVSKELKATVDKILSQIDYYQLSSYSSNTNHSYLSFIQDDLEDVDIQFNNINNDEFSCLIHLSLKEKGDLKILLQLDKKSGININIGVEQKEFKEMIQDTLQKLRVQINSLGLSIVSLNIFDLDDNIEKSPGLKAYGNNQNLDFGLDIKV